MRRTALLIGLLVVFATESPQAATLLIKPDGTGDYANIQAGLDAAAAGDTVLLAPGTYLGLPNGQIDWPARRIVLLSQAGANETVISGYDLLIENGGGHAADGSIVDGVSIVNAPLFGLLANFNSVVVRRCVLTANTCFAAVRLLGSSSTLEYCVFRGNRTQVLVQCNSGGSPLIRYCLFADNLFGEAGVIDIREEGTAPTIVHNTFVRNTNTSADHTYAILYIQDAAATISYNIMAFTNSGAATLCLRANTLFTCNDLFANEYGGNVICGSNQGGNFSADPLFCNAANDFTINAASPCAPDLSPCSQLVGALPVACGQPLTTVPSTFGSVKAMFRPKKP